MQHKLLKTLLLSFFIAFVSNQCVWADNPIDYSLPKKYTIADIKVVGAEMYDDFVLIGFSGLSVGQKIEIPGSEITNSVKKFWNQLMFSDVKIERTKVEGDKVWLTIYLTTLPKISVINFKGVKKSEKEDLEEKMGLKTNKQITPNKRDRAILEIKKYFAEKGYANTKVNIVEKKDLKKKGYVVVNIKVDKKKKVKVHKIYVHGNKALTSKQIDKAMKKTNDNKIQNIFRSKKFIRSEYEKDKLSIKEAYKEYGYRDAFVVSDTVVPFDEKSVDIHITVDEGRKYYFGDLKWIGNTVSSYQLLNHRLGIKKGELYNYKLLNDRLTVDEDAVMKYYQNNGYLFARVQPVETSIINDTINFELRLVEGKQATINNISINGNTRVYGKVIRRELYTKPGELYSEQNVIRSLQNLAQMNHFDNEKLYRGIGIHPNPENGTVDLAYNLETKSSDQVEFSGGWGAAGIVGSVGLKFTNFAIQNLFRPEMYRIVPQGEGQTFRIDARTNGRYYSSFSLSFLEPWLGGKRPNSLSVSVYYSTTSGISDRYSNAMNTYGGYYGGYGGYGYGGYGGYGYGGYGGYGYGGYGNGYGYNRYENEIDKNKYFRMLGGSVGYGKRLKWPDNYFSFYGELSYKRYQIKNWYQYETQVSNGVFNDFSVGLTLSRNSIDNPLFTRRGSSFSLGVHFTPPHSLLNGKDYSNPNFSDNERYKWIEYHKWKFSGKTFTPLLSISKTPVLMTRAEFAFIGNYNSYARTPFGTYKFGGDGMNGYGGYASEYVSMRGYETGRLTPVGTNSFGKMQQVGYLYNKFTFELRYPISLEQSATIWAHTFFEAGNSFYKLSDYNPFHLKRAAGVGVRVFLPMIGLLGLDWGYGFDPQVGETEAHGGQFHFVMGRDL